MNFEPFDTSLIIQRIVQSVPELTVGGAADYAAVQELRSFRTPAAYVVFADEKNTGKVPTTFDVCTQEAVVQFGVILALRNYREQLGEQMADDTRRLIGLVRRALIGHKPASRGARTVGWLGGNVLDYDASVLLFADMYQLHRTMHRDDNADS